MRYAVCIYYLVPMHQCKICGLLKWTLDACAIYTKLHELTYPRWCMSLVNFKHVQQQNYRAAVVICIVSLVTSVILRNKQEYTKHEFRHHWDVSFFIIIVFRPALKWISISPARILRMPLIRSTSLCLVHEIALLIQYVESITDILSPVPYQWGHAYNYYTLWTVTTFYTVT